MNDQPMDNKPLEMELDFYKGFKMRMSDEREELLESLISDDLVAGRCLVRVFEEHDAEMTAPRTFFLISEIGQGAKIDESRSEIMAKVFVLFGPLVRASPYDMVFIEHIPSSKDDAPDKYHLLHAPWNGETFAEASAESVSKEEVENLVGARI